MKTVIITDTHYGIKKNNKLWCDFQLKYIDKTIIPLIKKLKAGGDEVRVVHCGDVFESKELLNVYIMDRVISKFKELIHLCPIYIVAGNHDFYSMTDDSICALDLLFGEIKDENLHYVARGYIADKSRKELMLPFFSTENVETAEKIYDELDFKPEIVYCHTDLEHINPRLKALFAGSNIISGHIHIPYMHDNYYTIGSTYPLAFSDSNTPHGCYVMDDNNVEGMVFIENNDSMKFWRLYDNEIFDDAKTGQIRTDDYIEVYVNKANLLEDLYITKLGELKKKYRNCDVIPNDVVVENCGSAPIDFGDFDIQRIIAQNIPEKLKGKFQIILERIKDIS